MHRRELITGLTGVTGVAIAGCLGDDSPEPANEYGYETLEVDDIDVPLAPVTDVVEWYEDGQALFLDARGEDEFEQLRIAGAEWSPAPGGLGDDDPVHEVDQESKLVTYCVCPHSLATRRGAHTIREGYRHTYAIDEGLQGWIDQRAPVEGTAVDS